MVVKGWRERRGIAYTPFWGGKKERATTQIADPGALESVGRLARDEFLSPLLEAGIK